ncbi:MAG: right-handed parallel beta-helix repeat-containing protein [Conexivisphaerales archaeon]
MNNGNGCVFEGGIAITSWYSTGNNLTIMKNPIENSNRNGVLTGAGNDVHIIGNTIMNSGWTAIEIDDTNGVTIAGNSLAGSYLGATTNPDFPNGIMVFGTPALSNPPYPGFVINVTITHNTITASSPTPGYPSFSIGIFLIGYQYPINAVVTPSNEITGLENSNNSIVTLFSVTVTP